MSKWSNFCSLRIYRILGVDNKPIYAFHTHKKRIIKLYFFNNIFVQKKNITKRTYNIYIWLHYCLICVCMRLCLITRRVGNVNSLRIAICTFHPSTSIQIYNLLFCSIHTYSRNSHLYVCGCGLLSLKVAISDMTLFFSSNSRICIEKSILTLLWQMKRDAHAKNRDELATWTKFTIIHQLRRNDEDKKRRK